MLDTRKKFTNRGLTHSATHHLLAAGDSIDERGYARVSDIARALDITRGSVSVAMQSLKGGGFVDQDGNHFFRLTEKGTKAIASIRIRHEVVEQFLTEILGLPLDQSHRESCRMEYLIEQPTAKRLSALVDWWKLNHPAGPLAASDDLRCPDDGGPAGEPCPQCGLECLQDDCSLESSQE